MRARTALSPFSLRPVSVLSPLWYARRQHTTVTDESAEQDDSLMSLMFSAKTSSATAQSTSDEWQMNAPRSGTRGAMTQEESEPDAPTDLASLKSLLTDRIYHSGSQKSQGQTLDRFHLAMQDTFDLVSSSKNVELTSEQLLHTLRRTRSRRDWKTALALLGGTLAGIEDLGESKRSMKAIGPLVEDTLLLCKSANSWVGSLSAFNLIADSDTPQLLQRKTFLMAWGSTLHELSQHQRWEEALGILAKGYDASGMMPNPYGLSQLIQCTSAAGHWELAMILLNGLPEPTTDTLPDRMSVGGDSAPVAEDGTERLRFMKAQPYASVANVLNRSSKPEMALAVLKSMRDRGIQDSMPTLQAETASLMMLNPIEAIAGYHGSSGKAAVARAMTLLSEMARTGSDDWATALGILRKETNDFGGRCHPQIVSDAMSVFCSNASQWRLAFLAFPFARFRPSQGSDAARPNLDRRIGSHRLAYQKVVVGLCQAARRSADPIVTDMVHAAVHPTHWGPETLPPFLQLLREKGKLTSAVSLIQQYETEEARLLNSSEEGTHGDPRSGGADGARVYLTMGSHAEAVRVSCALSKWRLALRHLDIMLLRLSLSKQPVHHMVQDRNLSHKAQIQAQLTALEDSLHGDRSSRREYWREWESKTADELLPLVCQVCIKAGYTSAQWRVAGACP